MTGIKITEFSPLPLILSAKALKRKNILVGNNRDQVTFAEEFLGLPCKALDVVQDEDILGFEDKALFRVEYSRGIEVSHGLRMKVGIYGLEAIEKRSAGANAIVKYAAGLLGKQLEHKAIETYSAQLDNVTDIKAAVWDAVWLLTGPEPAERKGWLEPWTNPKTWLLPDTDPSYRLNTLYRDLVTLVFAKDEDWEAARKFGVQKSRFVRLQTQASNVDLSKVYASILELSPWRARKSDPLVCALKITRIWQSP